MMGALERAGTSVLNMFSRGGTAQASSSKSPVEEARPAKALAREEPPPTIARPTQDPAPALAGPLSGSSSQPRAGSSKQPPAEPTPLPPERPLLGGYAANLDLVREEGGPPLVTWSELQRILLETGRQRFQASERGKARRQAGG